MPVMLPSLERRTGARPKNKSIFVSVARLQQFGFCLRGGREAARFGLSLFLTVVEWRQCLLRFLTLAEASAPAFLGGTTVALISQRQRNS
jgi:hypothetical protein